MCTEAVMEHVKKLPDEPKNIVLFGIEAHVCVTQVNECLGARARAMPLRWVFPGRVWLLRLRPYHVLRGRETLTSKELLRCFKYLVCHVNSLMVLSILVVRTGAQLPTSWFALSILSRDAMISLDMSCFQVEWSGVARAVGGVFFWQVTRSFELYLPATAVTPHVHSFQHLVMLIFHSLNATRRRALICWSTATKSTLSATECRAKSESRHQYSAVFWFTSVRSEYRKFGRIQYDSGATQCYMLPVSTHCCPCPHTSTKPRGVEPSLTHSISALLAFLSGDLPIQSVAADGVFLTTSAPLALPKLFRPHDRAVALQRMQQVGAYLTTAEQVAFQLLETAENPK